MVEYATIVGNPCILSLIVVKNYGIVLVILPWNDLLPCCLGVVSNSLFKKNLSIDFILLETTSLALLKVGWVVVILTLFRVEWNCFVVWGILTLKRVFCTSPFPIILSTSL